jgi:hypothetical protein
MISVNKLCTDAAKYVELIGDGETLEGDYADGAVFLLNRAISKFNASSYFSSTIDHVDHQIARDLYFRKLEEGEDCPPDTVDMEPPEFVQGVGRKLGIRWLRLIPCNPQDMDRMNSMAMPNTFTYTVDAEEAPSGELRNVGKLHLNGGACSMCRVYLTRRIPEVTLEDKLCLSEMYHDILFWELCVRLCGKYKLNDYKADCQEQRDDAVDMIDRTTLKNRAMLTGAAFASGYDVWTDGIDLAGGYIG